MNRLRHKLIMIVCSITILVFGLFTILLYVILGIYHTMQADSMTAMIVQSGGSVPKFQGSNTSGLFDFFSSQYLTEESEYQTRYFVVYLDSNGRAVSANTEHIAAVDESTALNMAGMVLDLNRSTGYLNKYRYLLYTEDPSMVIFLDCSDDFYSKQISVCIVCLIEVLMTILITLIFGKMSKKVVEPFEQNAKRQRQFITDASHELKTPLAIISANAEVLQFKDGSNEWMDNIISQTKKMSHLIGDLLTLAKVDEMAGDLPMSVLSLSDLLIQASEPFDEVAQSKGVRIDRAITETLYTKGNFEQLKKLVEILLENATKYVTENGNISLSLARSGRLLVLQIKNTACLDPDLNCERLFDRFYRADSSRSSETGGHGIGLSIARNIAIQHGGTLTAKPSGDGIVFILQLPYATRLES